MEEEVGGGGGKKTRREEGKKKEKSHGLADPKGAPPRLLIRNQTDPVKKNEWTRGRMCVRRCCFFFSLPSPPFNVSSPLPPFLSRAHTHTHRGSPSKTPFVPRLDPGSKLAAFQPSLCFLSPRGPPQKTTYYANYTRCCAHNHPSPPLPLRPSLVR